MAQQAGPFGHRPNRPHPSLALIPRNPNPPNRSTSQFPPPTIPTLLSSYPRSRSRSGPSPPTPPPLPSASRHPPRRRPPPHLPPHGARPTSTRARSDRSRCSMPDAAPLLDAGASSPDCLPIARRPRLPPRAPLPVPYCSPVSSPPSSLCRGRALPPHARLHPAPPRSRPRPPASARDHRRAPARPGPRLAAPDRGRPRALTPTPPLTEPGHGRSPPPLLLHATAAAVRSLGRACSWPWPNAR